MSSLKIAWRSIQHRGLGSLLTVLSMALGVMLVVGVLTVHGVVSKSFKSNSNFPYDLIVGPSGSSMQVTMNSVFYLSRPVENIPYEYFLELSNQPRRDAMLPNSVAWQMSQFRRQVADAQASALIAGGCGSGLAEMARLALQAGKQRIEEKRIGLGRDGESAYLVDSVVPVNLGDYLGRFRIVGTTAEFFEKVVIDPEDRTPIPFAEGRPFRDYDETHQWYEAVLGAKVAEELGIELGEAIYPIHGDPNTPEAHTHDTAFTVVGIMDWTGTPNDRAAFLNMEGLYLMDGHVAPIDERLISEGYSEDLAEVPEEMELTDTILPRLPVEQREVTSLLVRAAESNDDEFGGSDMASFALQGDINGDLLEDLLGWSDYRPKRAKTEVQAFSPVGEVTSLFDNFVNPIRWVLLVLTVMICIVSAISILVGIYSSMSQRRHEIAVMRALGADRTRVMMIMLLESITLAVLGGLLGWVAGHGLNALAGPFVESRTGVSIGFWDFAPGVSLGSLFGSSGVSREGAFNLEWLTLSSELLLIPGLVGLAVLVGIYPAISAYRTDVAKSLG